MEPVVVAAVDFSDASRRALQEAAREARARDARIVLVHALEGVPRVPAYAMSLGASDEERQRIEEEALETEARRLSQEWVEPLRAEGLDVEVVMAQHAPEDAIITAAREAQAQLIVIGSHGWKGFKRLVLGSVAQSVLHDADVPVLVVPLRKPGR